LNSLNLLTTGSDELDSMLGGGLRRKSMTVILGHPGVGKTTFSINMVYENAKRYGVRCLYVSFSESKDKFYDFARRLGINLSELDERNLFKFIEMLTPASEDGFEAVVSSIVRVATEFRADLIVVDSITALTQVMRSERVRAFLHSMLYKLLDAMDATLVAIADLPWGRKDVELHGLEFIADNFFVFKSRVQNNTVVRFMEIKKVRGSPTTVAEVPFTISEGCGIRFITPVRLEEITPPDYSTTYATGCEALDSAIGPLPRGSQVLIIYPPVINTLPLIYKVLTKFILLNKLRTLIVSYSFPATQIVNSMVVRSGLSNELRSELLKLVVGMHSINPTAHSVYEIIATFLSLVNRYNPDLVIVHGLRTYYEIHGGREFTTSLFNTIQLLRKRGITAVRLFRANSPMEFSPIADLCELVIWVKLARIDDELKFKTIVWRSARGVPKVISEDEEQRIRKCFE